MDEEVKPLWQASQAWRTHLLGHGPGRYGAKGCVLFTLVHASRGLTEAKTLDPIVAGEKLRTVKGAFIDAYGEPGDSMVWSVAAPCFGLEVGPKVEATPGSPALVAALADALRSGYAAVRVSTDGGLKGQHTILATDRTHGGCVCICSALAAEMTLTWPNLENLDIHWGADLRPYRVVGVRAVRAASV